MHVQQEISRTNTGSLRSPTNVDLKIDPAGGVWSDGVKQGSAALRRAVLLSDGNIYGQGISYDTWWQWTGSRWLAPSKEAQTCLDTLN
jgi:hypothetical protein